MAQSSMCSEAPSPPAIPALKGEMLNGPRRVNPRNTTVSPAAPVTVMAV